MSNFKEIKGRISLVSNTLKITSAMKMVSSAKLHHAQNVTLKLRPYESTLNSIVSSVLEEEDLKRFFSKAPVTEGEERHERVALVTFSSNSAMCGAFNSNVIKRFRETVASLLSDGFSYEDIDVYAVGRKVYDAARKDGMNMCGDWQDMADKPSYEKSVLLTNRLTGEFKAGNVDRIILIYNHFLSASSQKMLSETYLPFSIPERETNVCEEYILEPGRKELADALIPKYLRLKIYTVLLDAHTAEHAARVVAMQVASDNAGKLLEELSLEYNKSRQQAITNELLDIVGGTMI